MPDDDEDTVVETSLDELIAKKTDRTGLADEEEDEETLLALSQDEAREALTTKVLPMQTNEFLCKSCFLVKHRSQLADRKRQLCRDCA